MTVERLRVTFPVSTSVAVAQAAATAGLTPSDYVVRAVESAVGLADVSAEDLVTTSPEPTVIIRLAPRPPGALDQRPGWVPDMTEGQWWQAASGVWRLGETSRAACRIVAAADPTGVIRHAWRIDGWAPEGDRWQAVGGRDVTESSDPADARVVQALLGRRIALRRNPVRIIAGHSQIPPDA
nr:hypothetical protein OHB51_12935 [Micromonospora sp. NBC_00855]